MGCMEAASKLITKIVDSLDREELDGELGAVVGAQIHHPSLETGTSPVPCL